MNEMPKIRPTGINIIHNNFVHSKNFSSQKANYNVSQLQIDQNAFVDAYWDPLVGWGGDIIPITCNSSTLSASRFLAPRRVDPVLIIVKSAPVVYHHHHFIS